MKNLLLLSAVAILLITGHQSLSAQDEAVASKLMYGELLGPGVYMSMNWDARFQSNERLGFGYRIGVGFGLEKFEDKVVDFIKKNVFDIYNEYVTSNTEPTKTFYSFPIGLNYIFGKPNKISTFEVGAGITLLTRKVLLYSYEVEKPGNIIGFFTLMYRLTPVDSGLSLRVGFTPMIGTAGDLFPMGAISLGYAF
jgi:hypothetical protein